MKRRTLLRGVSVTGALALAGCLSEGPGAELTDTDQPTDTDAPTDTGAATPTDGDTTVSPGGSDTPSDAPTDTLSETPDSEPSTTPSGVAEQSLDVTDSGCGAQTDDAAVSFDGNAGAVTVTGTIWGNDSCYTAVLSGVSLDGGTLTVTVAAESDADTDTACAECITEIDYEATVTLDSALPSTVTVVHDHGGETTRVTSVDR